MNIVNTNRFERIRKVMQRRQKDLVVVLEDIYDPHNAAAICRTCEAYGVQNVFIIFERVEPYDLKKVGKASSATANKWLDFSVFRTTEACFVELKKRELKIVSTVLDKEAQDLYDFSWPEKIALVLGSEHAGLSKTALVLSDKKIYIPMQGLVQSLNVSVAAGICLSEIFRSRLRT